MHYKDTTTGEYYGFKANSNCIEVTVEEVEAEREAAKTPADLFEEARAVAKTDRDTALMSMTHTLTDGSVVQVRPIDLTNFQIAIDGGLSEDWVLADNTVRLLTVAEMGECLSSGVAQAKVIWATYTDWLKANG